MSLGTVPARINGAWRLAQGVSVVTALGVTVLLVVRPDLGLLLTWKVLVPLVPAVLLFAPQIWRNLCPIGVVNQLPSKLGFGGTNRLSARAQRNAPLIAIGLFFAIVPLRLTVFDQNGPALAVFVVTLLVVAVVGGVLVTGKGGWCATLCPVLPVERLYGQQPILDAPHAHCDTCTGCIRSCYDLKPERSLDELVKGRNGTTGILRRPTGVFAVAFPGFVLGYFTAATDAVAAGTGTLGAYGWVFAFAIASSLIGGAIQWVMKASDRRIVQAAAALAAGLYYWFTVPTIFAALDEALSLSVASGIMWALRLAFLGLAVAWFVTTVRRQEPRRGHWVRRPASVR
ncbi:MAG: hypothetical protein Rubg2KO_01020 [Rubricoccaceae bacterium]